MPKIIRVNDESTSVNGTSYLDLFHVDYDQLVSKLGDPGDSFDGYKTDAEWTIEFEDGNVATVYNWKNGKNYCGESGLAVSRIKEWHIGGHNACVVDWIKDYVLHSWPMFDDIRQEAQY